MMVPTVPTADPVKLTALSYRADLTAAVVHWSAESVLLNQRVSVVGKGHGHGASSVGATHDHEDLAPNALTVFDAMAAIAPLGRRIDLAYPLRLDLGNRWNPRLRNREPPRT